MTDGQRQVFQKIIAEERAQLGTQELYILAPGLGEDIALDGVLIYGSIGEDIVGEEPGSCIVMTRKTWEKNVEVLARIHRPPPLGRLFMPRRSPNARSKAQALAAAERVTVGDVLTINETSTSPVLPIYSGGAASGVPTPSVTPPPVSPQNVEVTASVSITYQLKH